MKFTFKNTMRIQSDIDKVWNTIAEQQFEKDFLPEITRHRVSIRTADQSPAGLSTLWVNGEGVDIKLTNKDLNATIDTIEIVLKELRGEVVVTLLVGYRKSMDRYFLKTHQAIRSLFTQKLRVLKTDLCVAEVEFVHG